MTDLPCLKLPAELTIQAVGALMPAWMDWLDRHATGPDAARAADIDAQAVERVDTAGLQLLVSMASALASRGWLLHLRDVSPALADACGQLGLDVWLAAHRPRAALQEPAA